jgi:hypothetical protein
MHQNPGMLSPALEFDDQCQQMSIHLENIHRRDTFETFLQGRHRGRGVDRVRARSSDLIINLYTES